jgi:modulator of FtsH protease HflK
VKTLLLIVAAVCVGLLGAECLMVVDSGEVAVVLRVGAVHRVQAAGLGIRLPRPLEDDTRVSVTEVQRLSLDGRRVLTGDTNLVDVSLVAQFTVADPVLWVTGVADPEDLVRQEVEAATAAIVATMGVDALLTTARAELQQRIRDDTQARLDDMAAGIRLAAVDVRELAPPPAVLDAFNDVSSARGDQQTLALAADAYASTVIPDARGVSARSLEEARAAAAQRVAGAHQAVFRFQALTAPHAEAPEATRSSLRIEALARASEAATVVVLPAGSTVELDGLRP